MQFLPSTALIKGTERHKVRALTTALFATETHPEFSRRYVIDRGLLIGQGFLFIKSFW
jgi:hypothetical protein